MPPLAAEVIKTRPVPVAEFGQYVSLNHGNSNNGFITLYKVYYIAISINYSYTVYYIRSLSESR